MPSTARSTLSLHAALPILRRRARIHRRRLRHELLALGRGLRAVGLSREFAKAVLPLQLASQLLIGESLTLILSRHGATSCGGSDRKSTRLNSSHVRISYAVHRTFHSFPTRRSSDLAPPRADPPTPLASRTARARSGTARRRLVPRVREGGSAAPVGLATPDRRVAHAHPVAPWRDLLRRIRSEEHTSELQSRPHLVCRPPHVPLFPYTPLFRSCAAARGSTDAACVTNCSRSVGDCAP